MARGRKLVLLDGITRTNYGAGMKVCPPRRGYPDKLRYEAES